VDGIEIGSSFVRCCDTCLERTVQPQVDGERREDTSYYHRMVAVVLVSTDFPVPLGIRFQKDGESEVACAVRLLPLPLTPHPIIRYQSSPSVRIRQAQSLG
jgi:hypothetical protein